MTKLPPIQPLTFTMQKVALDAISANPANPRKHFDEAKLQELAASITAAGGILQAPGVRPLKVAGQTAPGKFVFIYGERRGRAAGLLKWKEIDVKVYDVDDVKAAELALIENDDREDLTPLERAEGYVALNKKHGLSVDQIAEQVNKSRAAVYETMALVKLSTEAKRMLNEKEITPSVAAMIAALPSEVQDDALTYALEGDYGGGPVSVRDFKDWVHDEFMLDLAEAPFDVKDAQLVVKAGACVTCPKRTGAAGQSDLFAEKGHKSVDLCKDKACFAEKVAANKAAVVAKAKQSGADVLTATESKTALNTGYNAKYVRLDQHAAGQKKTWAEALAKTEFEPVIAVDEEGKLVKVARKEDVKAALKKADPKLAASPDLRVVDESNRGVKRSPEAIAKEAAKHELAEKLENAAIAAVVAFFEKKGPDAAGLRLIAKGLAGGWNGQTTYKRRGIKASYDSSGKLFDKHFGTLKLNALLGLVFELVHATDHSYRGNDDVSNLLKDACELAGVDLKKLEAELTPKPAPVRCGKPDFDGRACLLDKAHDPKLLHDGRPEVAYATAKEKAAAKKKPAKKAKAKKAAKR